MPQGGPEGAFIRTPGGVVNSVCNLIAGAAARVTMVVLWERSFVPPCQLFVDFGFFLARSLGGNLLAWGWMRDVADQCVHGTTGESPIARFRRAEADAVRSISGLPPFERAHELVRKVQADCVVGVDGNAYSVPWRLIGESMRVVIAGDQL